MANSYIALVQKLISLSFLVLTAHFLTTIEAKNRTKLALRLIHRDSLFRSPYSQAKNDLRAPLVPHQSGLAFVVNISIGEPPIPQLLAMDTGSSLTWLQPHLCTACNPTNRPKISSTCKRFSCNSKSQCQSYSDFTDCEPQLSRCIYNVSYFDRSYCRGVIVSEKFTFATSDGGISVIPDLLFGCGLESHGNVQLLDGLLGLQIDNEYSLVSRVDKKFSYCIGNMSDPYYMYNQLVLGDGAVIEGYTTSLETSQGHYVMSIEGISVGEKEIEIDEMDFYKNVVLDSGSTLTYLRRSGYEAIKEEVVKMLDGLLEPVNVRGVGDRPCYWGDLMRDLKGFPTVTLHLDEETDLSLDIEGMFHRITEDVFCMAVAPVGEDDLNIIGVLAQQYYNVGFDLNEMKVSLLHIDCELLED